MTVPLTVLKGTRIVLTFKENLDLHVQFITALPIDKVRAQIEDPNLKIQGDWLWRIDQIPDPPDSPEGFNFYIGWDNIFSIMLYDHPLVDLDASYEAPPQPETFERFGEDDDGDSDGGQSVSRFTPPRRPGPGTARRPDRDLVS